MVAARIGTPGAMWHLDVRTSRDLDEGCARAQPCTRTIRAGVGPAARDDRSSEKKRGCFAPQDAENVFRSQEDSLIDVLCVLRRCSVFSYVGVSRGGCRVVERI